MNRHQSPTGVTILLYRNLTTIISFNSDLTIPFPQNHPTTTTSSASSANVRPGLPPQVSEEDLNPLVPLPPYPNPTQPIRPPVPLHGTLPQPPQRSVSYKPYNIYTHVDGGTARSRLSLPRPPPSSAVDPTRRAADPSRTGASSSLLLETSQ